MLLSVPIQALFEACKQGHVDIVEILLSASKLRKGQPILGQRDASGKNCLMVALENYHENVAEVILNDDEWG